MPANPEQVTSSGFRTIKILTGLLLSILKVQSGSSNSMATLENGIAALCTKPEMKN
jgi:hypothetical protein